MATMVNMNNLLNGKDSRWLQLEVCREFQRNKCSRPDTECKFAHPPANVEVQNGRVTACYDSIKGRCNREKPPCKYFHPPQHLKDQLLINGRNHLALKNALMQQMGLTPGQPLVPGQVPTVATNPYLTGVPQVGSTYSPYFAPGPLMPTIVGPDPTGVGSPLGVVPQTVVTQQKMPRSDRLEPAAVSPLMAPQTATTLEIGKKRPHEPSTADTDLLLMDMKSMGSFYYDNFAFPGMVPYKRPAADKSGVPVYQPNATTYQQLMQLQQPFVPVSCEYSVSPSPAPATSNASPAATDTSQLPQSSSQVAQTKEDDANTIPASTSVTVPPPSIPDPATLAKEVAQQNYAKAVKLAAANSSLTTNPLNHLNPLNYTGIALNKQAVGITSAQAAAAAAAASYPRFPALPVGIGTASTGLNHLAFNPYNAYAQTTNLLNFARAAPQAAATVFNPYSFIRAPFPVTTTSQFVTPNMYQTTGQYPVSVAAAAVTQTMTPTINNVPPPTSHIAAAAAQNNNNSVVPPYKKLKTS